MSQLLLSEQERHFLVSILQELDPSATKEKRAGVRRKVLLQLCIRRLGKNAPKLPQRVTLANVSRQGVALLTPSVLSVGERFVIPLEFGDYITHNEGGWLVLCQVKNTRRLSTGLFKVGAQFVERIDDPHGTARIPKDWLASQ